VKKKKLTGRGRETEINGQQCDMSGVARESLEFLGSAQQNTRTQGCYTLSLSLSLWRDLPTWTTSVTRDERPICLSHKNVVCAWLFSFIHTSQFYFWVSQQHIDWFLFICFSKCRASKSSWRKRNPPPLRSHNWIGVCMLYGPQDCELDSNPKRLWRRRRLV
jgi:hypothetical protein